MGRKAGGIAEEKDGARDGCELVAPGQDFALVANSIFATQRKGTVPRFERSRRDRRRPPLGLEPGPYRPACRTR